MGWHNVIVTQNRVAEGQLKMGPEVSGGGMPVPRHSPLDFIPHAAVASYWILLGRVVEVLSLTSPHPSE